MLFTDFTLSYTMSKLVLILLSMPGSRLTYLYIKYLLLLWKTTQLYLFCVLIEEQFKISCVGVFAPFQNRAIHMELSIHTLDQRYRNLSVNIIFKQHNSGDLTKIEESMYMHLHYIFPTNCVISVFCLHD